MRVIILNGPMGVGKTTVEKAIAMAIDNIHHLIKNYRACSKCNNGINVETIVNMIMAWI